MEPGESRKSGSSSNGSSHGQGAPSSAPVADLIVASEDHRGLLEAIVQSSRACVTLLDIDGRLLGMNAFGRLLMELEDLDGWLGREWALLWPEDSRVQVEQGVGAARSGAVTEFTAQCPTAKGLMKWWQVSIVPVFDREHAVTTILAASYDVTERVERASDLELRLARQQDALAALALQLDGENRRLAEAQQRITHSEKLRVLGQFVGSVAHDINNVLAVMQSAGRILRRRFSDATGDDILNHLDQSVERGRKLVRQVLDFARSQPSGGPEIIAIDEFLERDGELMRHLVGSEIKLIVECAEDIWPVLAPPQKFESVLFNLLSNARDASAGPSEVQLRARNYPDSARPIGVERGDWVGIEIRDAGAGMTPEVLARAGEPFFTTKAEGEGTGLGLASAFEFARESHGRVKIESELGIGTTITLYFPRSRVQGEPVETPDAPIDPTKHGHATLLIVEDEALVRRHLASMFRSLNYVVFEAGSEEHAVATVLRQMKIDLVISDLHLGSGSGARLADILRADRPGLPVIFVTGASGHQLPPDEIIFQKPIDERELARGVLEQLGRLPGKLLTREDLRKSERIATRLGDSRTRALFNVWLEMTRSRAKLPLPSDMEQAFAPVAEHGFLLSAAGDESVPVFRYISVGAALMERLGKPVEETIVSASHQEILGGAGIAFKRCLRGIAHFDFVRFDLSSVGKARFERLLLPLSANARDVTHVIGVVLPEDTSAGAGQ